MHSGLCELLADRRHFRGHADARDRGRDQDAELLAQDEERPHWDETKDQDRADGHRR